MAKMFLLVGAPAVGKSTTAHALAQRSAKSLHIPVDDLREMVVSGMAWPSSAWSSELTEQIALARSSAMQMAATYSAAGFDVVLDDFWDPQTELREYDSLQPRHALTKILLYPQQEIAEARNRERSGDSPQTEYIAEGIRIVYHYLAQLVAELPGRGWAVIDTSRMSIEETVSAILQRSA